MSSYWDQLDDVTPWRRYTTLALTALAVLVVLVIVAGPLRNAVGIAAAVLIGAASLLIGPRSPFFR